MMSLLCKELACIYSYIIKSSWFSDSLHLIFAHNFTSHNILTVHFSKTNVTLTGHLLFLIILLCAYPLSVFYMVAWVYIHDWVCNKWSIFLHWINSIGKHCTYLLCLFCYCKSGLSVKTTTLRMKLKTQTTYSWCVAQEYNSAFTRGSAQHANGIPKSYCKITYLMVFSLF